MGLRAYKKMPSDQAAVSNPELERAMDSVAKSDNSQTREALYRAILASTLIVPGSVSGDFRGRDGSAVAGNNTQISFRTIEHPAGHVILPAFTNVEALVSFSASKVQWVALGAQPLFQSILPGNIAEVRVNPFRTDQQISRPGGSITRVEFSALAQGFLPESRIADNVDQLKVAAGQKLYLSQPNLILPPALSEKLTGYFRQFPSLERAFLLQMTNQKVKSIVVGLQFTHSPDDQTMKNFMRGLSDVTRGQLPSGVSLDFMPLTGPFLEVARNAGRPIFEK